MHIRRSQDVRPVPPGVKSPRDVYERAKPMRWAAAA